MDIDDIQIDRRKKRRRRRLQIAIVYIAMAIGLAWFFESQATTTIIFVRHAEKEISNYDDPELTAEGKMRVFELTRQLKDADVVAGIDAIYSTATPTDFLRSLKVVLYSTGSPNLSKKTTSPVLKTFPMS